MTFRRVARGALASLLSALPACPLAAGPPPTQTGDIERLELRVTRLEDGGPGSLRQAILDAAAAAAPGVVRFDPDLFAEPQSIELRAPLPELTGDLVIDGFIPDRLWEASGVTVDGGGRTPILRVAPDAKILLRYLTLSNGRAEAGGAVLNQGQLVAEGVTFEGNSAADHGGAVANLGGSLRLVNSTFVSNRAERRGGALSHRSGDATVLHCTFSGNGAARGGAIHSRSPLFLRNSLLAHSADGLDCVAPGLLDERAHNLIESSEGCGAPVSADPRLEPLGHYNGPTRTFAITGGSPAINAGDPDVAVDREGLPLVWDQRGNGDPRSVGGFPDLGAFEYQRTPYLVVDTAADTGARSCTRAGSEDCSLRGALEIAAATGAELVRFDPRVFVSPTVLRLERPLPRLAQPVIVDASEVGALTVTAAPGIDLQEPGGTPVSWRAVELASAQR